jgi:hypothetical protein
MDKESVKKTAPDDRAGEMRGTSSTSQFTEALQKAL